MIGARLAQFVVLFIGACASIAQTTSNTTNPNWTTNGDWTGSAPDYDMNQSAILAHNSTISNEIIINNGYTLTINSGVVLTTSNKITIKEGGTLIVNGTLIGTGSNELKLEINTTLTVSGSGYMDWGGFWNCVNDPANITIDGNVNISGNLSNKTTISGTGNMTVAGTLNNDGGSIFGCTDAGSACCQGGGCLLPIELLSFTGSRVGDVVQLEWITVTEVNNEFFTIENSEDLNVWTILANVNGAGNSNEQLTYTFEDSNPSMNRSYYRLKQTDFDGQFTYFDAIAIEETQQDILLLYPNPVTAYVRIYGLNFSKKSIIVYDLNGKEIVQKVISNSNYLEFDISGYDDGIYFVRLNGQMMKFVKN